MRAYTINGTGNEAIENVTYPALSEAIAAWDVAGKPTMRGSSVWVTTHDTTGPTWETVETTTIS